MPKIVTRVNEDKWNKFVIEQPQATIYHTPEWKIFLEKTFSYQPYYLFALDENENITGLFPLFLVKSLLTGNRLSCLPFSASCGPIGEEDIISSLAQEAVYLAGQLKVKSLEVKAPVGDLSSTQFYSTFQLELSSDVQLVWNNVSVSAKRAVKKASKNKIAVHKNNDINTIEQFYELNCKNKKKLGVPCHPSYFFTNMFKCLKDYLSIYTVKHQERLIAGGIIINFKECALYGYGAADEKFLHLRPNDAFIWRSMADACNKGYKYYDFGRTFHSDMGLIKFKKKWGATERKLHYSLLHGSRTNIINSRNSFKNELISKLIRFMPMSIYRISSNYIFAHLG